MSELGVLLEMLDQENLSLSTQEKKTSVWNLLQQIQPSGPSSMSLLCSKYREDYFEINLIPLFFMS